MPKPKYKYKGKTLRQYCIENGLNYTHVLSRVWAGKPIEEAIQYRQYSKNKGYKYEYEGIPLPKWCKLHKISITTVLGRIYRGYSIEEAVKSQDTKVKYMYKGMSLRQYCIKYNLNYDSISQLIRGGRTIKEAIDHKNKYYMVGNTLLRKLTSKNEYQRVLRWLHKGCTMEESLKKANIKIEGFNGE